MSALAVNRAQSAWPADAPPFEIGTFRVFISHRYRRTAEYLRLVHMLERATRHDPRWRWKNCSIPRGAPIMTRKQSKKAEIYERRIRKRMADVHIVLFPLRDEWMDNVNSLYIELVEGVRLPHRPIVPVVSILPRGTKRESLRYPSPGVTIVKWESSSIIRAIRRYAIPASVEELRLSPRQIADRRRVVRALEQSRGQEAKAARSLGVRESTLQKKLLHYIIP